MEMICGMSFVILCHHLLRRDFFIPKSKCGGKCNPTYKKSLSHYQTEKFGNKNYAHTVDVRGEEYDILFW